MLFCEQASFDKHQKARASIMSAGGRASAWRLALPASTPEQRSRLEQVGGDASLVKKCSMQLDERGHIDAVFFFTTAKPYAQGLPLWQVLEKVGVPGVWQQIARDEQAFKAHASAAYFTQPQLEPPKERRYGKKIGC